MNKEIAGKTSTLEPNIYKKFFILTLAALAMAFGLNYFIIPAGILSGGVGGISQGFSYTLSAVFDWDASLTIIIYWSVMTLINIPVVIFTYFYYGKKLLYYSVYTFVASIVFSLFFTFTPGFNSANFFGEDISNDTVAVVIASFVGGLIYGIAVGVIFFQGSTSLGLDPLSRYLGRDKGYNFAGVLFISSFVNSVFWITIIAYIEPGPNGVEFVNDIIFSPQLLGSFIFIGTFSFVAGKIYPTSKKYLVEINSQKAEEISKKFNDMNYHRGHSIEAITGGYSKQKREIIKMVINAEEFYDVIRIVNTIDDQAFIYATEAKDTYSRFYWNPVTLEDKQRKQKREKQKKENTKVEDKSEEKDEKKAN